MGNAIKSIRADLRAALAFAGAGILVLSLVVAPPDSHYARIDARPAQLTSFALPPSAYWGALEKLISNRVRAVVPVAPEGKGGGASDPLTFKSIPGPAANTQTVETAAALAAPTAAALAAPTAAVSVLDPILGIVSPILGLLTNPGALLLFGPIILLVVLACPPCAVFNFFGGIIGSFLGGVVPVPAVALAATEAVDETATAAASLRVSTPDPLTTVDEPAEATPGTENGKAAVSSSVTSTEDVTEKTDQESTEPEAAGTPEPAAAEPTSEPVKPAKLAEKRRQDRADNEQQPVRPHRTKGGRPASETEGANADAAKPESSSAASPSDNAPAKGRGSSAKGKGSSAGDTNGSE